MSRPKNISPEEFQQLLDIQIKNKKQFSIQKIGSRKTLYIETKLVATTVCTTIDIEMLSEAQFGAFLGMFTRNLYASIAKNNLLDLKIEYSGLSRAKNFRVYQELPPGFIFYNVDLKSAYWQIARRLNYISQNVFEKYQHQDKYKSVKRLCISFLSRPIKREYHSKDGTKYTIACDTTPLRQVYENIRHELYNIITAGAKDINYIEYNIDGISVFPSDLSKVKAHFNALNLEFKTTLCIKLDEYSYKSGNKIKAWRQIPKTK